LGRGVLEKSVALLGRWPIIHCVTLSVADVHNDSVVCVVHQPAVRRDCSTPIQRSWPAGSVTASLQIKGELVDMTDVRIFINGEKVIDDRLSLLSGDGQFHGSYARLKAAHAGASGRNQPYRFWQRWQKKLRRLLRPRWALL
jgi:hypothetical protein